MPALTHNRVHNGFNGGRQLMNARTACPRTQVPTCTAGDAENRNSSIGVIGGRSRFVRAAIKRRVCFKDANGKNHCN
ncbi:MAG: hypothetical protein CXT73_06710 [Methanobacteriota archaeon]|nr:MAG: hypothetical protein CXT73_06710 [Euryarchaeota archaeon]